MTAFPDAIRPQEQSERLSQTLLRSTERETLAGVEVGQLIGFRIGGPVPREPRALQRQLEASTGTVGAGDRFHALHAAVHSIIFEVGQASIQAAYHARLYAPNTLQVQPITHAPWQTRRRRSTPWTTSQKRTS